MCFTLWSAVSRRAIILAGVIALTAAVAAAQPSAAPPPPHPVDRYVTVNGLRLHFLDWGNESRPPLILVHGLDRHAHTFDHLAPHFADRYHVIAVDMRGHGESAWDPDGRYLVEDYVRDMEGLVDRQGWRDIVIWGNSTGGRVAQVYAGMHPERVAGVISEDVGPERPARIANSYGRRVNADREGWESEDALIAQLTRSSASTPLENIRTYVRYGITHDAAGRIMWKRDPKIANGFVVTDLWQYVSRITAPALYILGGRSTIVPAETQNRLKTTLPHVQIVTVDGAGHYPSDEQAGRVLALVDTFLAARAGASVARESGGSSR
jgi:pimeloyl-ACP methyl ester carboxylesterase